MSLSVRILPCGKFRVRLRGLYGWNLLIYLLLVWECTHVGVRVELYTWKAEGNDSCLLSISTLLLLLVFEKGSLTEPETTHHGS